MSAFCVPTPCIIPLKIPIIRESKYIDSDTKIEILCDTELPDIEVFYTVDGTKPQPYVSIVQGSKTYKYSKPFCLAPGKITVKAMGIHSRFHTMCSSIITKTFYVDNVNRNKKKFKNKGSPSKNVKKSECEIQKKEDLILSQSEKEEDKTVENNVLTDEKENNDSLNNDLHNEEQIAEKEGDVKIENEEGKDENDVGTIENADLEKTDEINPIEAVDPDIQDPDLIPIFVEPDISPEPDITPVASPVVDILLDEKTTDVSATEAKSASHHCIPCELPLQHCLSCKKVNSLLSRYCDSCGGKLYKICNSCNESNPSIANFCQFCGEKFQSYEEKVEPDLPKVIVPNLESVGVQVKPTVVSKRLNTLSPELISRSIQTVPVRDKAIKKPDVIKKLPSSTPGRGYWRQQLDYICNHLKAHVNNNLEFQKVIGEPSLGKFIAANMTKDEGKVSIYVTFESLS